ncbi:ATP-grasp domain-containing protein [Streptomyces sp. CAU 1734]|uniref:carboxylate--amine ligase n=1 Tax=Streptomyces sp. CAU 1734 TaxID=3140360 RepID=UPI003260761F
MPPIDAGEFTGITPRHTGNGRPAGHGAHAGYTGRAGNTAAEAGTPAAANAVPAAHRAPFDTTVPALVLRLDRNPFHHGTLGAVRSLGRAGAEVHAVVEAADSPVARSRYLHRAHPRPDGPVTPGNVLELLLRVSDRIGRPAVLIAMDDIGAIHTAAHAARLTGRFHLPQQPPGLPLRLADKAELARICAETGIPHPRTVIPESAAEAADAVRSLGLPLVAKWSRPWLLPPGGGLRSTTLVHSPQEARALFERGRGAGGRLLLQRYLPDDPARPHSDWFFHGCFTAGPAGVHCPVGGSGRKELSWPVRTGLTAKGSWLPNPEVEAAALRFAAHVGYRGILDLDFRRDHTGRYRLLDANPRPGAQFRLFTDTTGLDVVRALYLDLTGQPVPRGSGGPGRVFVAENYALLSVLAGAGGPHRPARTPAGPARDRPPGRRPGVETAWYASDDLLPFLAMALAWLARGLAKAARRIRRPARAVPPRRPAVPAPAPRTPESATTPAP